MHAIRPRCSVGACSPRRCRMRTEEALAEMPVIAILRGVRSGEAVAIGEALVAAGIVAIEVPLNSPAPFDSIGKLAQALADRAAIGAGTVLAPDETGAVACAGGTFVATRHAAIGHSRRARARSRSRAWLRDAERSTARDPCGRADPQAVSGREPRHGLHRGRARRPAAGRDDHRRRRGRYSERSAMAGRGSRGSRHGQLAVPRGLGRGGGR